MIIKGQLLERWRSITADNVVMQENSDEPTYWERLEPQKAKKRLWLA